MKIMFMYFQKIKKNNKTTNYIVFLQKSKNKLIKKGIILNKMGRKSKIKNNLTPGYIIYLLLSKWQLNRSSSFCVIPWQRDGRQTPTMFFSSRDYFHAEFGGWPIKFFSCEQMFNRFTLSMLYLIFWVYTSSLA